MIKFKQDRVFFSKGKLRLTMLKEKHNNPLAWHKREKSIICLVSKTFYLPLLNEDVTHYLKTCVTCEVNQALYYKQARLLQPLPILNDPWECVSLNFITSFEES